MEQTNNDLKQIHPVGFKGIFKIYPIKESILKAPFILSLAITIIADIMLFYSKISSYDFICNLIEKAIGLYPNLLGFSLGGYALIVGFGNTSLLMAMTKKTGNGFTVFQKLNSIFAFSILLQVLGLYLAFTFSIINNFDFRASKLIADIVNISSTFIFLLITMWAILLVPYVVINIFTFGQMHHFYLTLEREKNEMKQSKQNGTNQ